MNIYHYLNLARRWFENLGLREKILVVALTWSLMYAVFSFIMFRPFDTRIAILRIDIKSMQEQILSWNKQIDALQKISQTTAYQEWVRQHRSYQNLKSQYKLFLQTSPSERWQDVIKTLLQSQTNITVVEIKNLPESLYNPSKLTTSAYKIFQQQLSLVIYSNYFDTLNYIQQLEKKLPSVHWDRLDYQVTQYPLAKVEMEFSILYEKNNPK